MWEVHEPHVTAAIKNDKTVARFKNLMDKADSEAIAIVGETFRDMNTHIDELHIEKNSLKDKIIELQGHLDNANSVSDQMRDIAQRLEETEKNLEETQRESNDYKEQAVKAEGSFLDTSTENENLRQEKNDIVTKIQFLEKSHKLASRNHDEAVRARTKLVEEVQKKLEDEQKRADEAEQRASNAEKDVSNLNKQVEETLDRLEPELAEHKKKAEYYENKCADLEDQFEQQLVWKAGAFKAQESANLTKESVERMAENLQSEKAEVKSMQEGLMTQISEFAVAKREHEKNDADLSSREETLKNDQAEHKEYVKKREAEIDFDSETLQNALHSSLMTGHDQKEREKELNLQEDRIVKKTQETEFTNGLIEEANSYFEEAKNSRRTDKDLKDLQANIARVRQEYLADFPMFTPKRGPDDKDIEETKHHAVFYVDSKLKHFEENVFGKKKEAPKKERGTGFDSIYGKDAYKEIQKIKRGELTTEEYNTRMKRLGVAVSQEE